MGCQYDFSIDIWSLGCIIYELLTSKILFPFSSPIENVAKALALNDTFDINLYKEGSEARNLLFGRKFLKVKKEGIEDLDLVVPKKGKNLKTILKELKISPELSDFIQKCLKLNPIERISPETALNHKFFTKY